MSDERDERPNPEAILYGTFACIVLPVSLLVFFLVSWYVAWDKGGWSGVLLNAALMSTLGFIGAWLAAKDRTEALQAQDTDKKEPR